MTRSINLTKAFAAVADSAEQTLSPENIRLTPDDKESIGTMIDTLTEAAHVLEETPYDQAA